MRVLSRTWQMLLKGIAEVGEAAARSRRPRWFWCAYAADLLPRTRWSAARGRRNEPACAEPVRRRSAGADHLGVSFRGTRSRPRGAPRAALAPSSEPVVRAPEPELVLAVPAAVSRS